MIKILKISFSFFCIIFVLSSCSDNKKSNLKKLVNEWQGKEIIFPRTTVFTKFGTDTVGLPEGRKTDYTILMYVDSSGCTACKMNFFDLKGFIEQVKDIKDVDVSFRFYFYPKSYSELKYLLKSYRFDIPVCIDFKNEINELNDFPSDLMFHTFLLDKNNRVLVIGNPVHNAAVRNLYIKTIRNKKSEGC